MLNEIDVNQEPANMYQAGLIIGALKTQLAEREKTILILRVRSRIEELEKRFLKPHILHYTRHQKWTHILTADVTTLRSSAELVRFRNLVTIGVNEFITVVCNLYGDFRDLAVRGIAYPISYNEDSVAEMLQKFGMVPDRSKINAVITLLTPIP
ncbi:uncharacterized protein LOC135844291 [Planococcus citri]|uniref:uncharacterized protein LOC135844291 n=1 Tax=Planococcus citri TaxID=170843 RepID=UPI0031F7DEA1